jgi:hypothetical protein
VDISLADVLGRFAPAYQQRYPTAMLPSHQRANQHEDRDAPFHHINATVTEELSHGRPVISVDTKKKELVGNYENKGKQWRSKGQPRQVNGHDFPGPEVPRAYPYGIYDLGRNKGFVNVGTDHDTATFAVASIRGWWRAQGRRLYPDARKLTITADGGGSKGLQRLVCGNGHHLPAGVLTVRWCGRRDRRRVRPPRTPAHYM